APGLPPAERSAAPEHSFAGCSNDIRAFRRRERRLLRTDRYIALDVIEQDGRGLAELVLENHSLQGSVGEAEQGIAEIGVHAVRLDQDPVESLPLTGRSQGEVLAHIDRSG